MRQTVRPKKRTKKLVNPSFFEVIPIGLYRSTPEGKLLDVNPAMVAMLGYPDAQSLREIRVQALFVDIEDRNKQQVILDEHGVVYSSEIRLRRKDGAIIWVRDNLRKTRTRGGRTVYEGSLEEITQAKIAEQRIHQLYEAEREQRELAEALQGATLALGFTLDTNIILDRILEQVAKVVPYDIGRVLLFENRMAHIVRVRYHESYVLKDNEIQMNSVYDVDQFPLLKWVLENGQPLIVSDTITNPEWVPFKGLENIRSWIGVPIHIHGQLLALFSLSNLEPHYYQPEHAKKLAAFAGHAALALEHARLFEAARRRAREAEILHQATATVTSELDLDQTLDQILVNLKRVVPYDSASIFLLEDNDLTIVAARGFSGDLKVLGRAFPNNNSLFRQSLTSGHAIILADAVQEPRFEQWVDADLIHGWIGVPLHLRGRAIGFLTIDSHVVNAYSESDAALAQAFANEVSIAIENARLFKELQNLATTDPLTEIWNRRHFISMAKREFQRARRYRQPLSLILFDIDAFKNVNDTYGHPAGDQVLRGLAKLCLEHLRQIDLLGRYGGEEFMILLPNIPGETARLVAERLRRLIAQTPLETDHGPILISASFGIAEMDDSCVDIDNLLKYADRAVYDAKFEGKNRVSISRSAEELDF
jgi:diguanylate cyclase (GGDEF)-like protein/PAS domain S-box-containing protein